MAGEARIRGMRVTVGMLVGQIGAGRSIEQVLADFDTMRRDASSGRAEVREVEIANG